MDNLQLQKKDLFWEGFFSKILSHKGPLIHQHIVSFLMVWLWTEDLIYKAWNGQVNVWGNSNKIWPQETMVFHKQALPFPKTVLVSYQLTVTIPQLP